MLKRLLAVWSTYWTSDDVIVEFLQSLSVIVLSILISWSSLRTGADFATGSSGTIILLFALLGLGIGGTSIVRQLSAQISTSTVQSRLTPNYVWPHCRIALLLLSLLCGLVAVALRTGGATWSMTALGMSAVISYVMIGAGGTFALGLPTVMYFIVLGAFWGLVYLFRISSLEAMAAAIQPWHAGLGLLSVAVLLVMAVYGLMTPRGDSAELGTEGGRRSVVENIDPSLSRREQSAERKWLFRLLFPELRGYHGGIWFRRLQLWQAAGSTGPLTPLIVVGGYISLPHVISDAALHPQSQFTLAIFVVSLLVAMNVYQRPEWFSVEWLRPVSRQTAVGDFLRGIAWDLFGIPLIVLVALVGHLLVDGASLNGAEWLAPILAGTAIYVLCVGVVSLLTLRGLDVMLGGFLLLFLLPIAPLVIPFGPAERRVVSPVVLIAIELGMILTGVSLIALARHRWLHRELK